MRQQRPEVGTYPAQTLPEEHALGQQGLEIATADGAPGKVPTKQRQYSSHLTSPHHG